MRIMVVGGGGREHAIVKKIKENPAVTKIFALPGNGGISADAVCVDIGCTEMEKIVDFAQKNEIDYAVVAPDDPLVMGLVDELNRVGIPCFGPNKKAAILEGSKVFSKELMKKYAIPTAAYAVFDTAEKAREYLKNSDYPVVIKADGLAYGKGVVIAENNRAADMAVHSIMKDKIFGESGNTIVIEEFLTGPEVSVLCFTDGKTVVPMVSSMDHKRIEDGDKGANTGGMGAIAPNPFYTESMAKLCLEKILIPTIQAMNCEDRTFKGCLYFGLMLTKDGPKVIEYNCRFGDPETQVVLSLLESDLLEIMMATTNGTLDQTEVKFSNKSAACVVMASSGYPKAYATGYDILLPKTQKSNEYIFVAGAKKNNDTLVTAGGRVLGAVAVEDTLEKAVKSAYELVDKIEFENSVYRKDIGAKALKAGV